MKNTTTGQYVSLRDVTGAVTGNGVYGSMETSEKSAHVSVNFAHGLDALDVIETETNGGGANSSSALAVINTSTASNGVAAVETRRAIKHITSHGFYAMFSVSFSTPRANSYQRIGLFNSYAGFFVGGSQGAIGVGFRNNSTNTETTTFNLDPLDGTGASQFKVDWGKLNTVRISGGDFGLSNVVFSIFGGYDKGWIPFHIYENTNLVTALPLLTPFLPLKMEVGNTGNLTDIVMSSGFLSAGLYGSVDKQPTARFFGLYAQKTGITTTLYNVVSLRSEATMNSIPNQIKAVLKDLSYSVLMNASDSLVVSLVLNATAPGLLTWTPVSSESTLTYTTEGSDISGGVTLATFVVGPNGSFSKVFGEDQNISLTKGQILTVAAKTAGLAATVDMTVNWREDF